MHNQLKKVRELLGKSVIEFAADCDLPRATIYSYESNSRKPSAEFIELLLKKFNINPIWLFTDRGSVFLDSTYETLNYSISDQEKYQISQVIDTAKINKNMDELLNLLDRFQTINSIQRRFRDIKEQSFWEKLIFGDRYKVSMILILGKVLSSFEEVLENSESVTELNSKKILIDLVSNYQLHLLQDQLKHFLIASEKDELELWIESNLSDFDCYLILRNIPYILDVLRDEVNLFNKTAF